MTDGAIGQILHEAEELLKREEYTDAIALLGKIDLDSASSEQKALFNLVHAQANLRSGNYQVQDQLENSLAYYKSRDDGNYALGKLLYALMLMARGEFSDANGALIEAYGVYKRCDDYNGQGWAMNRLAAIAYCTGDYTGAIEYLEKCIESYNLNHDRERRWCAARNLAQVLAACGRLKDSLTLFAKGEEDISQREPKNVCNYYLMRSIPHALLNDFGAAREMLKKAEPYINQFIREKAIYSEHLGWIYHLEGNYDKAIEALRQGLEILDDTAPESAFIPKAKRLTADAYIGQGELDMARKFADEAVSVAEKLQVRAEIAACHRIHAQIEVSRGGTDAARQWFDKALRMYSVIGSRYELAVTRYLAGMSGSYTNGEKQALLYLAREYFQSENVVPYVEKTERELAEMARRRSQAARSDSAAPIIICRNPAMKRLVELSEHIAPSSMSVLLTGPTGTGKDLFARYIHHFSGRKGRFVSVNAAAIPKDMVESELFGYRRGAYTGAATTTSGWIEEAEGGTLYLNEIADSSPELQAKLLDVIENRRVCRLGERQEREIDCRFIAATNHRLEQLIGDGVFRLDLFHRLNEIPIYLPPLSKRLDDIECLLEHFLNAAGVRVSTKADRTAFARIAKIFKMRPWPGNVRQMETEIRRLALICRADLSRMEAATATYKLSAKEETLAALQRTGWNRREVGRLLGISESAVRHRIKIYNLTPDVEK